MLSTEEAAVYAEWISNRRRLEALLDEMRDLSRQAGEDTLTLQGHALQGPARPRAQRHPRT